MVKESKNNASIFARAIYFIRDNLVIGYSLALLLLVPAAFFVNNYLVNSSYADVIDSVTRKKALLAERILNDLAYEKFSDTAALQSLVNKIVAENSDEIISLSVLRPRPGESAYDIVASSDAAAVGTVRKEDYQIFLARTNANNTSLDENSKGRFWKVTKSISGGKGGEKIGFMEMSLSLAEPDGKMNEVITYSYWVLALIVLGLVLLQVNQIRLMGYAFSLNKLKEVDKMKDMFISMASHELRAPLTAIKGYLDLLKGNKDLKLDAESARYLENISASSLRLERLVEDMLEVSRLEGNRFPMEISDFDPSPLIAQAVEEMRSQAIQKGLVLEYELPLAPVLIKADPSRFKQVVVNLVGNALKYTAKGSVKISVATKKDNFLVTVADTGVGISSEEQANLFQKFYRVKTEQTKNILGTGLGLWITMETVKRMKGKITVESIEGVGSHFTVHLPAAKK